MEQSRHPIRSDEVPSIIQEEDNQSEEAIAYREISLIAHHRRSAASKGWLDSGVLGECQDGFSSKACKGRTIKGPKDYVQRPSSFDLEITDVGKDDGF